MKRIHMKQIMKYVSLCLLCTTMQSYSSDWKGSNPQNIARYAAQQYNKQRTNNKTQDRFARVVASSQCPSSDQQQESNPNVYTSQPKNLFIPASRTPPPILVSDARGKYLPPHKRGNNEQRD